MLTMLGSCRRLLVLLVVGALTATLGGVQTQGASATTPAAPVEIRLEAITSAVVAPAGTPPAAVPSVLAVANQVLTVSVSFWDASGQAASFAEDTPITVTSDRGAVTSIDTVARQDLVTADLEISVPDPANRIRLSVAFTGGTTTYSDAATDLQLFDVLSQLRLEDSQPGVAFEQGIGGEDGCARVTAQDPVCGVVILPTGAASSQVLLSLGSCDDSAYSGCGDARGSVVQTLAALDGYSSTSPATIIIKCDKSLCGGGAIHKQVLSYTLGGNTALTQAVACPGKGRTGAEPACVDYVQSKRDGSGDTHLYLLFTADARVSVG